MRLPLTDPFSPVETHQRIEASREEVFNLLADPTTYPDWLVGAQRIRSVDDTFPEPGAKFDHSVGPSKQTTMDDDTAVLESNGHRRLVLEIHLGPFTGEVEFDLRKRGETTTELIMRERPTGAAQFLTPLLRPALSLRNQKSLRQLAQIAQHEAA